MALIFSPAIKQKLATKHDVTKREVIECFANYYGIFLTDNREEHRTDPPTKWFIGETDYGKLVKICFIMRGSDVYIRTAYEPNNIEIEYFKRHTNE